MSEAHHHLTTQALGARSLEDVLTAKQALRNFIQLYLDARETFRDAFEQLSHMEDIAREHAALPAEQQERVHRHDCLMSQVHSAYTLSEVTVARQAVDEWLAAYPQDESVVSARDYLTTMQEVLTDIAEQETTPSLLPAT